ncbi:MAG: hypothetical protein AAF823_10020 [Planctomycetota bacterium]
MFFFGYFGHGLWTLPTDATWMPAWVGLSAMAVFATFFAVIVVCLVFFVVDELRHNIAVFRRWRQRQSVQVQ